MTSILTIWEENLLKIINKILLRKESDSFKDPVPWESLGLIDYPVIITKPMDLNTIKTNILNHSYHNEEECVNDIRLIWTNSMIYNVPGSTIYSTAKALNDYFENSYINITNDDINKPPSIDELKRLIDLCHRISSKHLTEIINYLDKHCNVCVSKKLPKNEIEINVDFISGKLYYKLRQMIDSFAPELNRKYLSNLLDNQSNHVNNNSIDNKRKRLDDNNNSTTNKIKKIN